jgi:hypothetical protein
MKRISPRMVLIAAAFLALAVILYMIVFKTSHILYDESYFVPNIFLIEKTGLTKEFLLKMSGSPGPAYAVVHSIFSPFTNNRLVGIRLTNFFLLLLLLLFIFLNARLLRSSDPLITSASFLFAPMVWVSCGLALTEVPTMLCAMISLYFLLRCISGTEGLLIKILFAFSGGLFLSFAVLGRSFFLMAIIALAILLCIYSISPKLVARMRFSGGRLPVNRSNKQLLLLGCIALVTSVILPVKVFGIWKALAPPTETNIVGANSFSLMPWYCLLSFCYCGFATVLLCPGWFVLHKKVIGASLILSLLFLGFNIYYGSFEFAPFLSASKHFLSARYFQIYQRVIPGLVLFFSINFLFSSLIRLKNEHSPIILYIGITALLIAFSAIKVKAQFSSRYVAQVLPYFLLLFIPYEKNNWLRVAGAIAGVGLGFLSLYFYY